MKCLRHFGAAEAAERVVKHAIAADLSGQREGSPHTPDNRRSFINARRGEAIAKQVQRKLKTGFS